MNAKILMGGLLSAGLVLAGCGGAEELEAPEQETLQSKQAALSCLPGYTPAYVWYCGEVSYSVCRTRFANTEHLECYSATDSYDAGVVVTQCGSYCY
jgi:hypothetical protein